MKKLGFGLMRLPVVNGNYSEVDIPKMTEMVDAFLEAGGTYFDTAYPYHGGSSEKAFRETVVKRHPGKRFTITDKMPVYMVQKTEQMQGIFEEQLNRCGVEYFDYYWLHALAGTNYKNVQKVGVFDFLVQKKEEGRIRHIGFSFHDSPELLERILKDHPETEYVQLQLNYLDWDDAALRA